MRKNVASQTIAFQMNSTTDGSAVTTGTPTVYYTIDAGTQGTGSGTAAHEGNGQWSYVPAQAETNGTHVAFTMVLSGAISQTLNVWPVSFDPTDAVRMGMTALPNAAADAAGGLVISDAGGLDIDAMNTNVSAILTDTADMQPKLGTPAGASISADIATVDANVDAILLDTGTDGVLLAATATSAQLVDDIWDEATSGHSTAGTTGKALTDVLADTNELQTDDVPGLIAALNDISVADVLTTQMTEAYAADGTAPTLAQALFLIQQTLGDFSITGTTMTVYKLDGTTAAGTYTLNSSSAPTAITRSS